MAITIRRNKKTVQKFVDFLSLREFLAQSERLMCISRIYSSLAAIELLVSTVWGEPVILIYTTGIFQSLWTNELGDHHKMISYGAVAPIVTLIRSLIHY